MNTPETPHDVEPPLDPTGEDTLRGKDLVGSDERIAVDHVRRLKSRDPDAVIHLDGEEDDLYVDGIDIDDDGGPPAGTDGNR